jgi:2-oxo-4-hydroxy-4-carboxy-5-ureidoimidazoline decarboxylase
MITLVELNALPSDEFTKRLSDIFEHSPWVAEQVAPHRPFKTRAALHQALVNQVTNAEQTAQLTLLRAHPMLAGAATLTAASAAEQASHGLTSLDAAEAAAFAAANQAYQARFGFPFIIAVRGQRDRAAIAAALQTRLTNTEPAETAIALAEVAKIARFRLDSLIEPAGWLSVHVLDTVHGTPGADMTLTLDHLQESTTIRLGEWRTNEDGRCDTPLLHGAAMRPGTYQITFAVGAWRHAQDQVTRGFYDEVPIRFCLDDPDMHYHVPLLVAPYGYSTYRGS